MKNKNSMTNTEIKIAAAEYFVKHMLQVYRDEKKYDKRAAEDTEYILCLIDKYKEELLEKGRGF